MLVLQGLDDRVVPPSEAERILAALRGNGIPHAYIPFEGEDHGFRKASSLVRSIQAEARVLRRRLRVRPGRPAAAAVAGGCADEWGRPDGVTTAPGPGR